MAKSSTKTQRARDAVGAVGAAGSNPYLKRLIEDDDLRDSVMTAVDAARDAYDRLSSNGSPIDTAIDDKKVHKDLKVAAESLRDASDRLRGKKESHTFARLLLIAFAGAILALVLSEDLRKGLLDKVFGAEEEFEYNPPAAAPDPAPAASSD